MDAREALGVLGLRGPVDAEEVKRAYRRLARDLHPDAGGDVERFRVVQAAYDALRDGTDVVAGGPAPQARSASVDQRWWDGPSAWHDDAVDRGGIDLDTPVPDGRVVAGSIELLARLVVSDDAPARLVSRAPGSRLHRFVAMLDPELLSTLEVVLASDGRRPGHAVVVRLRAPGGRGRRRLADTPLPPGWVRSRGSDAVTAERRLRPSRDPADTAVRVARAVSAVCDALDWPLGEWFLLRLGEGR